MGEIYYGNITGAVSDVNNNASDNAAVFVTFNMTSRLKVKLTQLAATKRQSRSSLVRHILEDYLDWYEKNHGKIK